MSHDVACANEETRLKPKFYDNLRFRVKKKSIKSRRPLNCAQVEGRALRRKTCFVVCKFLLEAVFCRFMCVGQVIADRV